MAATLRLQVQVGPQEEDLEEADDMPKAKIARPRYPTFTTVEIYFSDIPILFFKCLGGIG